MDADSLAALIVVVVAALLLVVIAAVEAAAISLTALRARLPGIRPSRDPDALRQYIKRRNQTLGALTVARSITVTTGLACLTYLVLRETSVSWGPLAITIVVTIVVLSVLQGAPRWVVQHGGERRVKVLQPLMTTVRLLFFAPAFVLELPGRLVDLVIGKTREPDEAEQLMRLVEFEEREGQMQAEERRMIRGVFQLEETMVREVMRPRIDIVGVSDSTSVEDVAALIVDSGYSRIPLYKETIDDVVGIVYAKDLLGLLLNGGRTRSLGEIARPAYFIPESMRLDELLKELRQRRVHLAMVVDEYGGTAGLVTIEDLLEEIVGEIADEYDPLEEDEVQVINENEAMLAGGVSVDMLQELYNVEVEAEDFDTVGGLVTSRLGRVPGAGDVVSEANLTLKVTSMEGRRVRRLHVKRHLLEGEEAAAERATTSS